MATRQIDRRPKQRGQPTPEPAAIPPSPVGVRGAGSVAISGLVHADVDRSADWSGLGSTRFGVDLDPGGPGRLRGAAAGGRTAPYAAPSGGREPIRRATTTITYKVKSKLRNLELDTDKPIEFKAAILEFKRGGSGSSRDHQIHEVMVWLDSLFNSPEHKPSSSTLLELHAYCSDIFNTPQAELSRPAPPKGQATRAAPGEKPKKITFKQLSVSANLDILAARWELRRDDPRFLAATGGPDAYTFFNGLSPKNRAILTDQSLAENRVHVAAAIIKRPPAQKGDALDHLVRCVDHRNMTTGDIDQVRQRWHRDLAKLSTPHQVRYRERVEEALKAAEKFHYFDSLDEDDRLYVSVAKFRKLEPPDPGAVSTLKKADQAAARAESKRLNQTEQAALKETRVQENLKPWKAFEASFLVEVGRRVVNAGVDDVEWSADVTSFLAAGRKSVEGGTGVDKVEATVRNETRTVLKERYFRRIAAEHFPNLLISPELRASVTSDPDLDIGDIKENLEDAWNEQRGPRDRDTWISWMNLRLTEESELNPLPQIGTYPVHFSTKAAGITVPVVDSGTDARTLVNHMIGSRNTPRFDQIHVTLETLIQRAAGGYQQPHKYANGEYDFAFQDPAETGPWFNRWDRLPWIGERGDATSEIEARAAYAETVAKALVREALDRAYRQMVDELQRRAEYILTHGKGNPRT